MDGKFATNASGAEALFLRQDSAAVHGDAPEPEPFADVPSEAAYAELLPEILAVPDREELPVNLDVLRAVTQVLGLWPVLRTLRPAMQDELPRFNLERFDKLEKYALALSHAHTLWRLSRRGKQSIAALGAEVASHRDRLWADAQSLARHGLLDTQRLAQCKKANGYRAAASDVITLTILLKERWASLESNTPLTLAALNAGGIRALDLITAIGRREKVPADAAQAGRVLRKAFRLLVNAYEDARRAVAYLRRDQADQMAPSFWGPHGPRRRKSAPPQELAGAAAQAREKPESELVIENSEGLPITSPFAK